MQLSLIIALLAPVVTAHVYVCRDQNFDGQCKVFNSDRECFNLTDGWQYTPSSIGPDEGHLCTFYTESDCDGGKKRYVYPGAMTLGKWNDAFTSFYCEDISTEGSTNGFKNSLVEQVQKEMMEDM